MAEADKQFSIDNLQVLITAKKYFDNEVSDADSPLFPDVDIAANNLVCSFLDGDRRRKYGNKIPVTLTNKIMDEFSLYIKNTAGKKPNKPAICFLIYMLQNIRINQPAEQGVPAAQGAPPARLAVPRADPALAGLPQLAIRTKKKGGAPPVADNIYQRILENNTINLNKLTDNGEKFCQSLTYAIYTKNYDNFIHVLEKNVDLPPDNAKLKLGEIEDILKAHINDENYDHYAQIKIVDLYTIRNEDLKIDIDSIVYKLATYESSDKKNIISNLFNFLKTKKLITTEFNITTIINVFNDLNPNHCTLLSQDDPNIPYDPSVPPEQNMTRLFKDYNLTEIDKFININNGYCFTQEYLTTMLIAYRGSLTHAEVSMVPKGEKVTELAKKLAVYYENNLEKQRDDIIDGLSLYSLEELGFIIKVPDVTDQFKTVIQAIIDNITNINNLNIPGNDVIEKQRHYKFINECKELLTTPISKDDLIKFFTFMLNGEFSKAADMVKVKVIYDYSCNTIFELIGLAGYTLFSDMITQGENTDDDMFSISLYCIAQMEHLRQELEKIKILGTGTGNANDLAAALNDIKFGSSTDGISYEGIITSAETQCIHGVGRRCLDYYLRAYEAMQGFAQTLRQAAVAEQQSGRIKPIPDAILKSESESESEDAANEAIEKMFALAPYLVKLPLDLEQSTGVRYLTCLAHDNDLYSERNPNNHYYVISGFTTDLRFTHMLVAKYNNYRTPYYDEDVNNFSVKDSFNIISSDVYYTITPHQNVTYNGEYRAKANILAGYYNDPKNIMEFNKLLRIPYIFHRHRKATFKAFKDYTLHICKLMAEEYKPSNPPDNTAKYTALRTFTTDYKLTDYITMEELPLLPKHMTFLDLTAANHTNTKYKKEDEDKNVSKKMWNTGFDPSKITLDNLQELNKNYYIDTLENFLSLSYNDEYIGDIADNNKKAIIKTPETRKNVTRSYQFAQLLGKVLCNNAFNAFNRIMVPIEDLYKYFNNYFLNAAGQVSLFIDAPFKDINFYIVKNGERENINKANAATYTRDMPTNTSDIKIIAACIQNINTFSAISYYAKYLAGEYFKDLGEDGEAIKRITSFFEDEVALRMELIFTLFKIFFVIVPPNPPNDNYFTRVREYIRIRENTAFNARNYKMMFQSIIDIICSEGNMQSGYKYHFTELDKEFYLLKEIQKNFQAKIGSTPISTKNDTCINAMIEVLNEKFAYFNSQPEDTDVQLVTKFEKNQTGELTLKTPTPIEYIQDAKPLAIEYINKIELISMHALRMYVFWIFEKIVIKLSNLDYYYGDSFNDLDDKPENQGKYAEAQTNIETKFRNIFDFEYEEIGISSMLRELKKAILSNTNLTRFLDIMQDEIL